MTTFTLTPKNAKYIGTDVPVDQWDGFYYVDCIPQAGKATLLSGPYRSHAAALADVENVRRITNDTDPRSHFMAFGTCRSDTDRGPGILQRHNLHALSGD